MLDRDCTPYKQGSNAGLRHDEYRLLERDNWLFGETTSTAALIQESKSSPPGPRGWL